MQSPVSVNVPRQLYDRIRRAAEQRHRSVDDLVLEAISAAAPVLGTPESDLRAALAQLAYLNDAALWQAARATLPPFLRERMEALHAKQRDGLLSLEETTERERLEQLFRDTLLVRAQAAVLLKQRNYNISDLSQFAPIE